jgi:uncharacterized protein (TIGR00156 family)
MKGKIHIMRRLMLCFATLAAIAVMAVTPAMAQFQGPTSAGRQITVEAAQSVRPGTYVVLTGNIVARLRDDYYTFRDSTGEIRVEIEPETWVGREVTPEMQVRLLGEVDRTSGGLTYVWVESLDIVN